MQTAEEYYRLLPPSICKMGGPIVQQEPVPIMHLCSLQAAVEYFQLMLPPWDAKGLCNEWEKMAVRPPGPPHRQCSAMHSLQVCVSAACQGLSMRSSLPLDFVLALAQESTPILLEMTRSRINAWKHAEHY